MSAELQKFQKKMLEIKTVKEGLQEAHKQTYPQLSKELVNLKIDQ